MSAGVQAKTNCIYPIYTVMLLCALLLRFIKTVTSKSVETAAKAVESGKKTDDDGSGLSSALDKTFVFKKD